MARKRNMSLEQKIEIFEKYFETGGKLTGSTVFEGYPIGRWAILIRSSLNHMNKGENEKVDKKQIKQLKKLGILKRQIDSTVDEKIEMLVQWMEKYPKVEIMEEIPDKVLREYSINKKEYLKMQRYYKYVIDRFSRRKLSKEQILKCKEGNLRGRFGYPSQIEELAKKSGESEKTIDYIISNYKTMDNFKRLYREGELDNQDLIIAQNLFRRIIDVDLNPDSKNYESLYMAICGDVSEVMELYSSETLKSLLDELEQKEKYIIERSFGLTEGGSPKDLGYIGSELGVSRERVRQFKERALSKLRKLYKVKKAIIKFGEGSLSSEERDLVTNETYRLLTEEEKKLCSELLDNIFSSDFIYSNSSYETLQEDEKRDDIIKGLEFLKNRQKIIEEREKQLKKENYIELENTNISFRAYKYFKNLGIETIGDLSKLIIEDYLYLIQRLGKEEFIKLFLEISKYRDVPAEYIKEIEEIDEEDLEKKIEYNKEWLIFDDVDDIQIECLNLSTRTYNSLVRRGIMTLMDIVRMTEEELKKIRNLGEKGIKEILDKVHECGFDLRRDGPVEDEEYERLWHKKLLITEKKRIGKEIPELPIIFLDLSIRTHECLEKAGIETVKQLSQLTDVELKQITHGAVEYYNEIINKVQEYGIILEDEKELIKKRSYTALENTNISFRAYKYFKNLGIETIGDLSKLIKEDHLYLIKILGKEEYLKLLSEINKYRDISAEYIDKIKETTEAELEKKMKYSKEWLIFDDIDGIDDIQIKNLNLSKRAYNSLVRRGIMTLMDIVRMTEEELKKIRNLGEKGVKEILDKVHECGFDLRRDGPVEDEEYEELSCEELFTEEKKLLCKKFPDLSIIYLDFTVRTHKCLEKAGIETVKQLSQLTDVELKQITHGAEEYYNEIINKLQEYGINLRDENKLSENTNKYQEIGEQDAEDGFVKEVIELAKKRVKVRGIDKEASKLKARYKVKLPKSTDDAE